MPGHTRLHVLSLLKSDMVAVLVVLLQYPRYYWGNGYEFYGITSVLGSKFVGIPWGWGSGLRYYRSYGVGFAWTVNWCMNLGLCICKFQ